MGDDSGIRFEASPDGVDVVSDANSASVSADHLVVMVHGILGSTSDWKFGAEQFVQAFPDEVIVHCSKCNIYGLTLDGVDIMGERLASEVAEIIDHRKQFRKISFVAHSVGGLVARYAIGRLYKPCNMELVENPSGDVCSNPTKGTIYGLEAINFITAATPHLGSRGKRQVPFLFGFTALEKTASCIIHWIFRRTGRHLFLTDCDDGKPPLLLRMVNDCGDLYFMSGLRSFKRRVAYSNACYDHIVGWRTSSIRRNSELPKWEDSLTDKYPHIVYEESTKEVYLERNEQLSTLDSSLDQIEEELVTGLTQVSWKKVDVSFQGIRRRFAAHSVIQVKDQVMHSEGGDVIQHMIDQFLT